MMAAKYKLLLGGAVIFTLFFVFSHNVFAQTPVLEWELQLQSATPSASFGFEIVYDGARQEGVLFGGVDSNSQFFNETWVWDGDWHRRFPTNSPSARHSHAMAYDEVRGEVVLFGGALSFSLGAIASNETWVWNGVDWIQKFPADSPPARYGHVMSYDATRQEIVLFGGRHDDNCGFGFQVACEFNDTWAWDGVNWIKRQPTNSPPATNFFGRSIAMAHDPGHQQTVLFIGSSFNGPETWLWDGTDWRLAFASTSIPGLFRINHRMVYDPSLGGIVMFGGGNTLAPANDVWLWNGSNWIEIIPRTNFSDPNVQPSKIIEMWWPGLIYDVARQKLTAYGDAVSYQDFTLPSFPRSTWVLVEPAPSPLQKRPVIIIPGILGSWEKNGEWVIDPVLHIYDNLIQLLESDDYIQGVDLFTFPYDWKQENTISGQQLKIKIEKVRNICQCQKVDIIAHSMGGLVARSYAQSDEYQNDINQIIFLGTPHEGSSFAYLLWEGGEVTPEPLPISFDRLLEYYLNLKSITSLSGSKFRYIRNNVFSVRDLLPTYNYLKEASSGIVRSYPNNHPVNPFLGALNSFLSEARLFQRNIGIINIVGNIEPNFVNNELMDKTLGVIRVVPRAIFQVPLWEYGYPENFGVPFTDGGLEFAEGDGRVFIGSANHNFQSVFISESNQGLHSDLPTIAWPEISKALLGATSLQQGIPITIEESLIIPILSPADIQVVDPLGRRIGKDFFSGQEVNEIPLAFYSGFNGDLEFVSISNPVHGQYQIKLDGTDNGSYTLMTSYISDDAQVDKKFFGFISDIQELEFSFNFNSQNQELISELEINYSLDNLRDDIEKAYQAGWIIKESVKDQLIHQVDNFDLKLETIFNPKARTEVFKNSLNVIKNITNGHFKIGFINDLAHDMIIRGVDYLTDTL